jgi:hypothetical protein
MFNSVNICDNCKEESKRMKMQKDFQSKWRRDGSLVRAPFPEISGSLPSNLLHFLGLDQIANVQHTGLAQNFAVNLACMSENMVWMNACLFRL